MKRNEELRPFLKKELKFKMDTKDGTLNVSLKKQKKGEKLTSHWRLKSQTRHTRPKLTKRVGKLTAKAGRIQTCDDAAKALLNNSVLELEDLLIQAEKLTEKNKRLGYSSTEEFIDEAINERANQTTTKATHSQPRNT